VSGQPDVAVGAVTSTVLAAPAGSVAVTVRARRGGVLGAARSARVTVPPAPAPTVPVAPAAPVDAPPFGDLLLTKVDRRNYGLLGFAIDPDTSGPIQVLVTMTGEEPTVVNADFDLAGLEDTHPGYGIRHGFLFLKAGVAPGEKDVCAWALDATGGPSTFLGCRHATIK
jgi:hypothetical protein